MKKMESAFFVSFIIDYLRVLQLPSCNMYYLYLYRTHTYFVTLALDIYSYTFKNVFFKSVIIESVKIKIFSKSVKMAQIVISENI